MSDTEEIPLVPMELNLRVDILDNEGIWNTGKIVDVSHDEEDMVEIRYDGWGDEYNEWIPLSANRLAPLHMYTMVKKCWAKLTKWPWWPAFVVLRAPTRKSAADALNAETKIYVEFFDSYNEEKRSRCWMQKKNIESFKDNFDERASKNIGKNFPAYVEGTQRAMAGSKPVLFSGNGTLPIEFSSKYTVPLSERKAAVSDGSPTKWSDAYRIFSNRYRLLYGYEFAKDSTSVLAAQGKRGAKGKGAKAALDAEEDDGDDEVEIVGTTTPLKRGRGRPAGKQAKKQPKQAVYADEEDDEGDEPEKESKRAKKDADEDYDDAAEEAQAEGDNGEAAVEESPRGRRSSRTSQRKANQLELTPTRRATPPRRAKDDAEDVTMADDDEEEDDDDFGEEGEDFNHYEYEEHDDQASVSSRGRTGGVDTHASSRSTSPDKRYKARGHANKKVHKRKALKELLAATSPQPVLAGKHRATAVPVRLIKGVPLGAKTASSETGARRSPLSETKSSSRRKLKNIDSVREDAEDATTPESSSLKSWVGLGVSDEGSVSSHRSWSIQRWLANGFTQKAAATEATLNEA